MEYRKLANRREDIYAAIRVVQAEWQKWIDSHLEKSGKVPGFNRNPLNKEIVRDLNIDHSFRGCCVDMSEDLVKELKKRGIHSEEISLANEPEYKRFLPEHPDESDHYGVRLDDGTIFDISINQFIPEIKVLERVGSRN